MAIALERNGAPDVREHRIDGSMDNEPVGDVDRHGGEIPESRKVARARMPLARRVAQRIQDEILSGKFADGARLPPQRELAVEFGVSRTILSQAIASLEKSGIIRTEAGSGSYVSLPKEAEPQSLNFKLTGDYEKLDICRFRHVMEGACARLAAMRITDQELEALRTNVALFKEQVRTEDFQASAITDEAFHHLIVRIAGVRLFIDMHSMVRPMLLDTLTMPKNMRRRGWEPVVEHERILEALRRRDPDEAVYYMQSHIARSSERVGFLLSEDIV